MMTVTELRRLFPYPFCPSCFEQLHDGHFGWDVCATCAKFENLGALEDPFGKKWDECPCYREAVNENSGLPNL